MAWRQGKVMFISKPGESECTKAKFYHPISPPPFLLKTMEKLVDKHVRECTEGISSAWKPIHLSKWKTE
jgi:hypothetical protein